MRVIYYKTLLLLAGLLVLQQAFGQIQMSDPDSVPLIKPGKHYNSYKYVHNGSKEIKFDKNPDIFVKTTKNSNLRDFGNYSMTLLSGLGFGSSSDGYWKVSGTIQCNDTLPFWNVFMFCGGRIDKERERVRGDDGSWSVETNKTSYFFWKEDAGGIIIEGVDTIGNFFISMNPDDELYRKWSASIFPPKPDVKNAGTMNPGLILPFQAIGNDFEVTGKYRNRSFAMIHNGSNRKVWIFLDDLPVSIFQGDLDYPGVRKKYRNSPYLLLDKDIPLRDRRELFRLATMSRFMNIYLSDM